MVGCRSRPAVCRANVDTQGNHDGNVYSHQPVIARVYCCTQEELPPIVTVAISSGAIYSMLLFLSGPRTGRGGVVGVPAFLLVRFVLLLPCTFHIVDNCRNEGRQGTGERDDQAMSPSKRDDEMICPSKPKHQPYQSVDDRQLEWAG